MDQEPTAATEARYGYAIEAVENAAKTLLMLRTRSTIRAVDVSAELGVARSTAHRMVSTLAQAGLLQRNLTDKTYTAGHALVELGMVVADAVDVRPVVQPLLTQLAFETGETAHFLIREQDEVLFTLVAEGTYVIRSASRVGSRLPAHTTSAGKCLLATLTSEELSALYPPGQPLEGGTERAIRDRGRLLDELARVAEAGWAVNRSESEPGLYAVSVAVPGRRGRALGAITISGPAERLEPLTTQTVEKLRSAVAAVQVQLAGAPWRHPDDSGTHRDTNSSPDTA